MIQFTLTKDEEKKAKKFILNLNNRQKNKEKPLRKYWFVISPTGIGDNITIHSEDGKELDITDYSRW